MKNKSQRIDIQLTPYIILGIAIALLVGLFVLFSYVLVWGVLIGAVIWLGAMIKRALFPRKAPIAKHKGRIIEHHKD